MEPRVLAGIESGTPFNTPRLADVVLRCVISNRPDSTTHHPAMEPGVLADGVPHGPPQLSHAHNIFEHELQEDLLASPRRLQHHAARGRQRRVIITLNPARRTPACHCGNDGCSTMHHSLWWLSAWPDAASLNVRRPSAGGTALLLACVGVAAAGAPLCSWQACRCGGAARECGSKIVVRMSSSAWGSKKH